MKITNAEKIPVNMKISLSLVLKLVLKNLLIFLLNHFEITISVLYIFKLLYKTWKYVGEDEFSTYQKDILFLSLFHLLSSSLVF